jgi:uncharacterized membrane protein YfcA
MTQTVWTVVYSLVSVYAGGCVKGLTGFGFSLISVGLLVLVAPPSEVVPVVLLMNVLLNLLLVHSIRKEIDFGRFLPLAAAGIIGLPVGTYILLAVDADILRMVIGLVTLLSALALLAGYRREIRRERLGSILVGAAGGVLNASVSISGPPVVLFLSNLGVGKREFRANIVAYFLCINLATIPFFIGGGLMTGRVLRTFALLVPALALGALTGARVVQKVSERNFRHITLVIVIAAAVMAVTAGIRGLSGR